VRFLSDLVRFVAGSSSRSPTTFAGELLQCLRTQITGTAAPIKPKSIRLFYSCRSNTTQL